MLHTFLFFFISYRKSLIERTIFGELMNLLNDLHAALERTADAAACIRGSESCPCLKGTVRFYQLCSSVLVTAELEGLPSGSSFCNEPVFAFHIHEGNSCTGNSDDPFADAMGHYNPHNCSHPYHAGDMPPLFGVNGSAFLAFTTDRFWVNEILGRAVIVHAMSDDFHTQPSGNAGEKIGCGIIHGKCR